MPDNNQEPAEGQRPEGKVELKAATVARINLADFQNAVPAMRELVIHNTTTEALRELDLQVSSEPAFFKPRTWHLDAIDAGQIFHVTDLDIQLDGGLLARLNEAEKATVRFKLVARVAPDVCVAASDDIVELLPRNQWGGIGQLPEMVAAFVQPNDPAVDKVLKNAAEILHRAGRSGAIDGYTKGPTRAWELTSAIWSAVVACGVDYSLPPASFEHAGQKVRGPGQVLESGLATCLDLTLLFASALEQAHLNPVVVFTKGHSLVGAWLRQEEFSTAVVDDVTALRKRVKLKELVLFETTLATQRPAVSFSQACDNANNQIAEDRQDSFELAVDVRRARMSRIKPLAIGQPVAQPVTETELPSGIPAEFEEAPELPDEILEEVQPQELDPKDRLSRWQRKLLDLSLRNTLLNFKAGKKVLILEAPDAGALEDLLAENQAIKILAAPDLMEGADPRSKALHESREREDVRREVARDALARREVFVRLAEDEMDAKLVDLFRGARNALQEGGANTLFLALGFLVWTRTDKPDQRIKAPLLLVPVTLNRRSARSGFTITAHEDEPRFNPTLIEMLRQDFQLELGVGEGELPRDDSGIDVAGIWRRVATAIRDIKGWEVSGDVVLSTFSFAKFLMWKDLAERADQLRQSPVVKHLIDTPREAYSSGVAFPEANRLDKEFAPHQTFCPLPADSSQLSAVMAAVRGKDFVLIGPPGTGKSQTISNLIAQCLAEGKRVLFVAEKIAALDVVYRRLREVGLGEFCLELHSNKARKLDVLAQLHKAWEAKGEVDKATWEAEARHLAKLREELSTYVERLHHRHRNGLSIFSAIGHVVGGEDISQLRLRWDSADTHDMQGMQGLRSVVDKLDANSDAVGVGKLMTGPLAAIGRDQWSPRWQEEAVATAESVDSAAKAMKSAYGALAKEAGLPDCELERHARGAVCVLAKALPQAHGHMWAFLTDEEAGELCVELKAATGLVVRHRELSAKLTAAWSREVQTSLATGLRLLAERDRVASQLGSCWSPNVAEELATGLSLLKEIHKQRERLSVKYTSQAGKLNVMQMQRDWAKAKDGFWPASWLGKRKVAKLLLTAVEGTKEPSVEEDLDALVKIRSLRDEVEELNPGAAMEGIWVGMKTRLDHARSAQLANAALAAAKADRPWRDEGLDAAAEGRCGERWTHEVRHLRRLRELDDQIEALGASLPSADGLWSGRGTNCTLLKAAMEFEQEKARLNQRGVLNSAYEDVNQGHCGGRLQADFKVLTERALVEAQIDAVPMLGAKTKGLWAGLDTDIALLERALRFHSSLSAAIQGLAQHGVDHLLVRRGVHELLEQRNHLLAPGGSAHSAADTFLRAWGDLQPAVDRWSEVGGLSSQSKHEWGEVGVEELSQRASDVVQAQFGLRSWCAWRKARGEAITSGLAPLVGAVESGGLSGPDIRKAFDVNYSRWWLAAVVENETVVRTFVSAEHERRIGEFRALDDRFTDVTRKLIRARLCAELPAFDAINKNTEWGVLRHEVNKKKRHLPLRDLLSRIPSVVLRLTPCLLMSPLSIAQYLSADAGTFDLVVFDEASQIPVWDAIGAMARGRQVVMVGDPKQLPPTSFFGRAESDVDDEDVEGDLESILDECLGASLPTRNLSWHYRSRHESLIAFSNSRYYGGGLVTFPSPVTEDRAVSLHHVKGVYEKGGARINKPEARALVEDLVRKLKSPGFRVSKLTIGVVTFNSEQQALIEDMLDEERRRDPSIESYFSEVELEPVFVKNLESVQGDERDIMYFSITYGPDASGAVSMNFGPLNRDGGERRLNVAVTRARHELRVFSSLKGEQMDLSRTRAMGVRDLKHFLEFAERGPRALAEATMGSRGDFESPFEEAVAAALGRKGWQVHTQIGASSFRVDLGIVHPDRVGMYLAGVECDGATYHRSATARDRDKLREQVLRGLGWEVVRIWSTDWWVDPRGTLELVHAKLTAVLDADRERIAEEEAAKARDTDELPPSSSDGASQGEARGGDEGRDVAEGGVEVTEAIQADAAAAIAKAADTSTRVAGRGVSSAGGVTPSDGHQVGEIRPDVPTAQVVEYARSQPANDAPPTGQLGKKEVFLEADLRDLAAAHAVHPDRFFESNYDPVIKLLIDHVVAVEGPVQDAVLARRVARIHGFARTGSRIQERIESLAAADYLTSEEDGVGTFFWPRHIQPGEHVPFRWPTDESSARGVEEICLQELVALARQVKGAGKSGEDAVIAMAREVGLLRLRSASRQRVEEALRLV